MKKNYVHDIGKIRINSYLPDVPQDLRVLLFTPSSSNILSSWLSLYEAELCATPKSTASLTGKSSVSEYSAGLKLGSWSLSS